jgi:hypothetical protein
MSDFFATLAARSVGAAPAVAPRAASRFEAGGGASVPAEPAAPPAESPSAASAAEPPASPWGERGRAADDVRPPAVPPRIDPVPPRREVRGMEEDDPGPSLVPRRPWSERDRADARVEDARRDAVDPPPPLRPSDAAPRREIASAQEVGDAMRIDPPVREVLRPAADTVPPAPAARRPSAEDSAGAPRIDPPRSARDAAAPVQPVEMTPISPPRRERDDPPLPVLTPRVDPLPPPVMPRLAPAPALAAEGGHAPEPAAPTIRITIGRIEVRATAPAAAPAPPRPSAPARQPLDDYLRAGAGRRP